MIGGLKWAIIIDQCILSEAGEAMNRDKLEGFIFQSCLLQLQLMFQFILKLFFLNSVLTVLILES